MKLALEIEYQSCGGKIVVERLCRDHKTSLSPPVKIFLLTIPRQCFF